jgi:hypothetical protein
MPTRTPSNGLERANQNETFQPEPWAIAFVFMLFFLKRSKVDISQNLNRSHRT